MPDNKQRTDSSPQPPAGLGEDEAESVAELKSRLEQYRHMVELDPQVPWVADRDGKLFDFSPRWLELTGLTREQALTTGWTEVPHPDDLPKMLAAWSRSMETGAPLDVEHRIRVADGSYRWMRTRAFPRRIESSESEGEITAWHGYTEDVDRRVKSELALQKSEARYRSVIETAQEGVWMVDADYTTTFVNSRMAQILGREPGEIIGKPMEKFVDPRDQAQLSRQRRLRKDGESGQYDCRYVRKDGSELWVIASEAPMIGPEGEFEGATALMTDITERKNWELELARLAAIVESSEDAIVSKDMNGVVTSWNASAERIYGWKAEEIIGKSKALVMPPDLPNELPSILSRIAAGQRIAHYETRRMRKDGTIIDVAVSVSPVKDSQGHIVGAATIVRDISERRRAERELQRKHEEVEALNGRLRRAMQETHHRVKNNLQIVCAMIDLQAIEHVSDTTVPLCELERLGMHIRTLAIVHDLLTTGIREEEEDQRVNSAAVIGRLVALLGMAFSTHNIHAQVADVALLSKQAVALSLALNELVSNAVKYAKSRIDVELKTEDEVGELLVCDDGRGFAARFNPLTDAHTGIELVQGLAQTDLRGTATFENRPEGGACVRIRFPLINNDKTAELPGASREN